MSDTKLQILFGKHIKGRLLDNHKKDQKATELCTIKDFLDSNSQLYKNTSEPFLIPATNIDNKSGRFYTQSIYTSGKFKCSVMGFDLDLTTKGWGKKKPLGFLNTLLKKWKICRNASFIGTTKGGIRIFFVLSEPLEPNQWQFLHDKIEQDLFLTFGLITINKKGKLKRKGVEIANTKFQVDRRTPAVLIRAPYGYRDEEKVIDQPYFAEISRLKDNNINVNVFGNVFIENLPQVGSIYPKGYERSSLPYSNTPDLSKVSLPENIYPIVLDPEEIPEAGGRDNWIYSTIVHSLINRYLTKLTPQQYLKMVENAVNDIDGDDNGKAWIHTAWNKIRSNYPRRLNSYNLDASLNDIAQVQNVGNGFTLFSVKEYEQCINTKNVYKTSKKFEDKIKDQILKHNNGTLLFNSPAGAGKSAAAHYAIKNRDAVLYVTPNRAHITKVIKDFPDINVVHSYEVLISDECKNVRILKSEKKILREYYKDYTSKIAKTLNLIRCYPYTRLDNVMTFYVNGKNILQPFSRYVTTAEKAKNGGDISNISKAVNRVARYQRKSIDTCINGVTTVLTLAMLKKRSNHFLDCPDDMLIVIDESQPVDFVEPIQFKEKLENIEIWGNTDIDVSTYQYLDEVEEQLNFLDFLKDRPSVLINADKGLKNTLENYKLYDTIELVGEDMPPIFDPDLHYILCPDLTSGYVKNRVKGDAMEYDCRVELTKNLEAEKIRPITDGRNLQGNRISLDNIKTATGSNDFINSHCSSTVMTPSPSEIKSFVACTGLCVEAAKNLLVQNKINQMVSRNTGWRCFDSCNERTKAEKMTAIGKHKNAHYCFIPMHFGKYTDLNLCVRTSNVWTCNSPDLLTKRTPAVQAGLYPRSVEVLTRKIISNIEPDSFKTLTSIYKQIKEINKNATRLQVKHAIAEFKHNINFAAFEYMTEKEINGERFKRIVFRHPTIEDVIGDILDGEKTFTLAEVVKIIGTLTRIKIPIKILKAEIKFLAPDYGYTYLERSRQQILSPKYKKPSYF